MHQSLQVRPSCRDPWPPLVFVCQEGRISFSAFGEGRCLEAVTGEEGASLLPGLCSEGEDRQRWTYRWGREEGSYSLDMVGERYIAHCILFPNQ